MVVPLWITLFEVPTCTSFDVEVLTREVRITFSVMRLANAGRCSSLLLGFERVPETCERAAPFRDIRQVEWHADSEAEKPMRADDFLVGIIHHVERHRGQGSYFQAGLRALDVFTELVVEPIVPAENPHVRVTIQPRQKHAPFDIAARHAGLEAVEKVRSLDVFKCVGGARHVHTPDILDDVVALEA